MPPLAERSKKSVGAFLSEDVTAQISRRLKSRLINKYVAEIYSEIPASCTAGFIYLHIHVSWIIE